MGITNGCSVRGYCLGIINGDFNWGFNVEYFKGIDLVWGFCMRFCVGNLKGVFNWGFYTGILHKVIMRGFCMGTM